MSWRRLQIFAAVAATAALVVPMALQGTFEPFIVAMAGPLVVGLLIALRWPRVAAVWLGVVSLALAVFTAPFAAQALGHPEAVTDFVSLVAFMIATAVAAVAAIPAFRAAADGEPAPRAPRAIAVAAGGTIVVAAAVAAFAASGIVSVPAEAGDIRVVTEDGRFEPARLQSEEGTVAVHLANLDATRHTFTIDELGVDLSIAPNSTQRVTFLAEAGEYRFYCRPHTPGMEGILVVG